ncbi:MAG: GTPase, partial [bacterium]
MKFFDDFKRFFSPEEDPDLTQVFNRHKETLPTLWLLGKTGAGKSSLIHSVTGDSRIEIGNGFSPCTKFAYSYDFPQDKPLLRFLDTRGLGEPGFNPEEDVKECQGRSHMLIVVMKAEEPEQGHVLDALRQIKKSGRIEHILLVHTGIYLIADEHQRFQCVSYNQDQVEKVWSGKVDSVHVDFELHDGSSFGVDQFIQKLSDTMPIVAEFMDDTDHADQEKKNFIMLKKDILWHAGIAGASDAVPVTG